MAPAPIQAKVRNYRGIGEASILIDRIALIAGRTWQGKTSVLEGVGAAASGHPVPFLQPSDSGGFRGAVRKADAGVFLREDAKRGSASVAYVGGGEAAVNWPGASTRRDDGSPWASEFAAGLASLPDQSPERIGAILAPYIDTTATVIDLANALEREGLDTTRAAAWAEELYPRIQSEGWDALLKERQPIPGNLRGQWQEVTGEHYGSQKAATWEPQGLTEGDAKHLRKDPNRFRETTARDAKAKRDEQNAANQRLGQLNQTYQQRKTVADRKAEVEAKLAQARENLATAQKAAEDAGEPEEPGEDRATLANELEVSQTHLEQLRTNQAPSEEHLAELRQKAQGLEALEEEVERLEAERDELTERLNEVADAAGEPADNLGRCAYCGHYNAIHVEAGSYFLSATEQPPEPAEGEAPDPSERERRDQLDQQVREKTPTLEAKRAALEELSDLEQRTATAADIEAAQEKVAAAQAALDEHDRKAREAERDDIRQAERDVATYQAEVEQLEGQVTEAQQAEQEVAKLAQDMEAATTEAGEANDEANRLEDLVAAIDAYLRAHELYRQIVEAEAVANVLKPEGLRQAMLAKGLDEFSQAYILPLVEAAGWPGVGFNADLVAVLDDRPYYLLSTAERLIVRTALHTALARLEGSAFVAVDGADVLKGGLTNLLKLAWASELPFVISASFNRPDRVSDLQKYGMGRTYWVEDGTCQELGQVLEGGAA